MKSNERAYSNDSVAASTMLFTAQIIFINRQEWPNILIDSMSLINAQHDSAFVHASLNTLATESCQ